MATRWPLLPALAPQCFTIDNIESPGVINIPRYIYLSTTSSGSPSRISPVTPCPGTRGTALLPGGRNSINLHFVMPTLISLVVTQLVTRWQKRCVPLPRKGRSQQHHLQIARNPLSEWTVAMFDCPLWGLEPHSPLSPLPSHQ